ncbi:MAG: serine/threonine protein phosphatase, partial [Moorea sp. SIO3E2]|nr:serine/threonine protein phosphatase [Moorena sp. SIO3E2]
VYPIEVKLCDRLLLCSDGLTEELSDELIASSLQESSSIDQALVILVEAAKDQGGRDNITVVIVEIGERMKTVG